MITPEKIRTEMERCLVALDKFGADQDELRSIRTSSEFELSAALAISICSCDINCSHEQIAQLIPLVVKLINERARNRPTTEPIQACLDRCAAKHIALHTYQALRIELSKLEDQAKPSTVVEFRRKNERM